MKTLQIGELRVGNDQPLTLIAGPCQLESFEQGLEIGAALKEACDRSGAQFIFKASYDKANRTSAGGVRGMGMAAGLDALGRLRETLGVPVLTDVHAAEHCAPAAEAVDILQIPAFLCRQTDLLIAAGETGAVVNVKKGQFLAPWDMPHVIGKIESTGNTRIMLTERGASFGYNTLVADMRSLPTMMKTGYPVVMDATHSVQQPGGLGGASGGQREFAPVMARAAGLSQHAGYAPGHGPPEGSRPAIRLQRRDPEIQPQG